MTFETVFKCTSSLRDELRCHSSEKPGSGRREDQHEQASAAQFARDAERSHDRLEPMPWLPAHEYIMTEDIHKISSSFQATQNF